MDNQLHTKLFSDESDCLSLAQMKAYEAGQLTPMEQHGMERHLLDCDLCADAYEGLLAEPDEAVIKDAVEDIKDRAWQRVAELERRKRRGAWIWLSAAASIVMVISVSFFVVNNQKPAGTNMDELFSEAFESYPAPEMPAEERNIIAEMAPDANETLPADKDNSNKEATVKLVTPMENLAKTSTTQDQRFLAESKVPASDVMTDEVTVATRQPLDMAFDQAKPETGKALKSIPLTTIDNSVEKKDATTKNLETYSAKTNEIATSARGKATVTGTKKDEKQSKTLTMKNQASSPRAAGNEFKTENVKRDKLDIAMEEAEEVPASMDDYNENWKESEDLSGNSSRERKDNKEEPGKISQTEGDLQLTMPQNQVPVYSVPTSTQINTGIADGSFSSGTLSEVQIVERLEKTQYSPAPAQMSTVETIGNSRKFPQFSKDNRKGKTNAAPGGRIAGPENNVSQVLTNFQLGMQSYQAGNFSLSAQYLENEIIQNPSNTTAHFYAAQSYLNLEQAEKALPHLDMVIEDKATPQFHEDAYWYKALAYIKLKDRLKARGILEAIVLKAGKYKAKAEETLKKL